MKMRELLNEAEEKWTEGAVTEIYSVVLLTDSLIEHLNNIIFNYFIDDFSKICW